MTLALTRLFFLSLALSAVGSVWVAGKWVLGLRGQP